MAVSKSIQNRVAKKNSELTEAQKQKAAAYKQKVDSSNARRSNNYKDVSSRLSGKTIKTFGLENTTSATGLEKAIFVAGDNLIKAQQAVDDFLYGKFEGVPDSGNKVTKSIKKAIDQGLLNSLDKLAEIDLCNILNYSINKIPGSTKFDPEKKPSGSLESAKWNLQKTAYDTQLKIDAYNSSYLDTANKDSKAKAVYSIINEIKDAFKEINDPTSVSALRDPKLVSTFPQIGNATDIIEKYFVDFNKYTDYRQIPSEDVQNIVNDIDRIRQICILLQGLSTPASAISFADYVFPNANIADQVNRLEQLIPHEHLYRFLNVIVKSLSKLQSICNVFSSFISFGQVIVNVMILIVKALKIIVKFIKALPIPLVFVVSGTVTTIDDLLQNTVLKFIDKILQTLNEINTLLSLCLSVVSEVSLGLYYMVSVLNGMLENLKACTNPDDQLVKDMQDQRDNLLNTANGFQDFINNYQKNNTQSENTFGKYTIQIVTEQVVDDAIKLKRRYGIAQETNGIIVAQSQPTYASDDRIIVNEVKQLLASLGLIKYDSSSSFTLDQSATIEESLRFLMNNKISLNDVENITYDNGLDPGNNEDENNGLGLNAFVNKLKGGKKLREKMRKIMKQNSDQLKTNLSSTGTNVSFNAVNFS